MIFQLSLITLQNCSAPESGVNHHNQPWDA
jgi:hypothetical protein